MSYKEEFVKKVLDKTDILQVVGKFTKLREENGLYIGKCPLHKDGGESIVVYPSEQVFHCFGCGKGGNAAMFLMERDRIRLDKAIDKLARAAGITPTKDDIAKSTNDVLKDSLYNMYKDAAIFYMKKIESEEGVKAMEYLKERGITPKTMSAFGLGYSPEQGRALYKYLSNKGYTDDLMLQSGLIKSSENGPYDMFRGRVMFPIMDRNKHVIAFGGRRLNDDDEKAKNTPKYLNSPETPIFNKSTTLYGVHDLKGNEKYEGLFLVEGYMDVIALHQAGFRNSVAALGTAFTPTHIPEVKKYASNLILTFDGDSAGQKAAMRAIKALDGSSIACKVLSLAPYKDPDEFMKALGKEEYKVRVARSIDKVDFQLKYMAKQYDMNIPEQKQEYLTKAVDALMKKQEREIDFHSRGR